jgi:hypothetical protein
VQILGHQPRAPFRCRNSDRRRASRPSVPAPPRFHRLIHRCGELAPFAYAEAPPQLVPGETAEPRSSEQKAVRGSRAERVGRRCEGCRRIASPLAPPQGSQVRLWKTVAGSELEGSWRRLRAPCGDPPVTCPWCNTDPTRLRSGEPIGLWRDDATVKPRPGQRRRCRAQGLLPTQGISLHCPSLYCG